MNETTYPVEPWELRAYVEEDPSRTYQMGDPFGCIIGRYCNERLDGRWAQEATELMSWQGGHLPVTWYPAPEWAYELTFAFDTTFSIAATGKTTTTGKDILEADILPRGDA